MEKVKHHLFDIIRDRLSDDDFREVQAFCEKLFENTMLYPDGDVRDHAICCAAIRGAQQFLPKALEELVNSIDFSNELKSILDTSIPAAHEEEFRLKSPLLMFQMYGMVDSFHTYIFLYILYQRRMKGSIESSYWSFSGFLPRHLTMVERRSGIAIDCRYPKTWCC